MKSFFPPALLVRKTALTVIGFKVFINLSQSEYPAFFLSKKVLCPAQNLWIKLGNGEKLGKRGIA